MILFHNLIKFGNLGTTRDTGLLYHWPHLSLYYYSLLCYIEGTLWGTISAKVRLACQEWVVTRAFFRGNLVELSSTTSGSDSLGGGGCSPQSLVNTEVWFLCLQVTALHSVCNAILVFNAPLRPSYCLWNLTDHTHTLYVIRRVCVGEGGVCGVVVKFQHQLFEKKAPITKPSSMLHN